MSTLPSEVLRRYDVQAKKSWGQCFLHDPAVLSRIVAAADVRSDETVAEIGAGIGVLTQMLAEKAQHVIAIERDRDMIDILKQEHANCANITLHEGNALTYDFSAHAPKINIVGNLPYNIGSPLLFRIIEQRRGVRSATLMLQREVVQRIVAGPGSKTYGGPSVICQRYAVVRYCFTVGRGAFRPAPRVDSAVVRLEFKPELDHDPDERCLSAIVRQSFQNRRKMMSRSLATLYAPEVLAEAFAASNIAPSSRPEELGADQFATLARALNFSRS